MEQMRKRMLEDINLFPEFGGPRKSTESSSAISIASTSSSGSVAPVPKAKARLVPRDTIIISSDEEDSEEDNVDELDDDDTPHTSPPAPPTNNTPSQFRTNNTYESRPPKIQPKSNGSYDHDPKFAPSKAPAKPIHIPSNRDITRPMRNNHITSGDGEMIGVPGNDDDNENMTSADAEKALRDLMGGGMNVEADVEIDMEDAVVKGFREGITLLPHQIIGRAWMRDREDSTKKRTGGILADDMGLGKTIQTLTRIVEGRARKSDATDGWAATTLVICPLALVGQWADEINKMAVGLTVIKHQGTARTSDPGVLRRAHVVVTTYDTVKSEYEGHTSSAPKDESQVKSQSKRSAYSSDDGAGSTASADHFGRTLASKTPKAKVAKKSALFQVKWWRVVLDEAHNIKNEKTKGAIACCELQSKFRWCLTGTPMQNSVSELYSLIKFLRIKPLSNWDTFNTQIAKPVKNGKGAAVAMKRLQVVLKQIMLRRRKDQQLNGKALIELPKRLINIVSCPFEPSEQAFYDVLESKMDSAIENLMNQSKGNNYISVLLLLLRLRQACNHPILVTKDYKKDMDAVEPKSVKKGADDRQADGDDLIAAFGQLGVTRKCQVCTIGLGPDNIGSGKWETHCVDCEPLAIQAQRAEEERPSSAKIRMILKLLTDIEERSGGEEKTIIFSQFTSMLDLIEPFLKDQGIKYVRYDGSMLPAAREYSLDKIKRSKNTRVILISFKAGSTGLNLTACNNVILVDLWWNPALEDQAFDRSHRFGQTRDVNIHKLKVDGTVEDRILMLQDKKRELAKATLSGDKIKDMRLGMDDLLALFRPGGRDDDEEDYPE